MNAGLLGVLTLLIVPVQMLLVAFAMRGFKQGWNVELERRDPAAGAGVRAGGTRPRRPDVPPEPRYPLHGPDHCGGGGTVDAEALKRPLSERACGFDSHPPHHCLLRSRDQLEQRGRQRLCGATRIPHGRSSCTGSSSTARPARSQISVPAAMSHGLTVRSKYAS